MNFQDFQCSKCSYPAHIPFSVQWSDDDCIALATEKGAYITGGGWTRRSITIMQVLIIMMLLGIAECGNMTSAVFGDRTHLFPAAFGDFNSDEYPDLFVIDKHRKSIEILLGADVEPFLRASKNLRCQFDLKVTSIVPGDFDGDALMDVLVTLHEGETQSSVFILWGNGGETLDCSQKKELFKLNGQPLAMDYNQDMIIDLFGSAQNERMFWVFKNKSAPTSIPMLMDQNRKFPDLRIPHSHAFLDMNGDFAADLVVTTEDGFEVWVWNKEHGNFEFDPQTNKAFPPDIANGHVGQSLFLDIELKGNMNHLLPVCKNKDCSQSTIYVNSSGKWLDLKPTFFQESVLWGFVPPQPKEMFLEAITLHGGDFNMDGFPDLLATLQHGNIRKTFLLENVECKTSCNEFSRTFVVNWQALDPYNNNTVMGVFYDFMQDGILDIIFVHDKPDVRVSAFKNNLDYDANFVKVMVITGIKDKKQPVIPGPLGGRKNRTYGTNLPGPQISYETKTQEGYRRAAVAAQLPQSAYFCLHLPYTLFGLGRTPNFIDTLIVGISGEKRNWPQIIPNSQMVVIPRPKDHPEKWTARLFVTPSKLIVQSFVALLATCLFISLIIAVLYWKERREDNYERFHFLH